LLQSVLADLPQRPRWVDGSGLSRYNLFTPQDMVTILRKIISLPRGMERLKSVFATGGEGTLKNFYTKEAGNVYAKTGTLSGVVCVSGILTTNKGKIFCFSVMVNNNRSSSTDVRREVETFIRSVISGN
jgi:serine-type D-Ala-D-Ala carboxypeptidase/endopeptidase (penicillin-binding protein 4)